jgi:hypothetical protein
MEEASPWPISAGSVGTRQRQQTFHGSGYVLKVRGLGLTWPGGLTELIPTDTKHSLGVGNNYWLQWWTLHAAVIVCPDVCRPGRVRKSDSETGRRWRRLARDEQCCQPFPQLGRV